MFQITPPPHQYCSVLISPIHLYDDKNIMHYILKSKPWLLTLHYIYLIQYESSLHSLINLHPPSSTIIPSTPSSFFLLHHPTFTFTQTSLHSFQLDIVIITSNSPILSSPESNLYIYRYIHLFLPRVRWQLPRLGIFLCGSRWYKNGS